jgi:hypothetical protein
MRIKLFISILLSILLTIPTVFVNPCPVSARNYIVQLTDEEDANGQSDLKSIAIKDDYDFLYLKFEAWKTWNLLSSDVYIEVHFRVGKVSESNYVLTVLEKPDGFSGHILNKATQESNEITVNFDVTKSIGTAQIDRKLIKMRNSILSFRFYTLILDDPEHFFDAAPNDQSFVDYTPGPDTEKPVFGVSSLSVQPGNLKKNDKVVVTFDVMNKGEGSIDVAFKSTSRLRMITSSLTLYSYETQEVSFLIDTNNLESQYYTEGIEVTSNFGNFSIEVTFFVYPEPQLYVSKLSLDYGNFMKGEKQVKKVIFSNKADGPITVNLSTSENWIKLNKSTFESQTEEISVFLSTKDMAEGVNKGKIHVSSNGGSAVIDVSAIMLIPVVIDKTEFNFGDIDMDNPKVVPISFTLKNQTKESLTVKITCLESWVTILPEVKLQIDETKQMQIAIRLDKMEAIHQLYQCYITFEAKSDSFVIPVIAYLKQETPTILWVSDPPGQKEVEGKIESGKIWEQAFTIKNGGGGTMNVSAKWENTLTNFQLFTTEFSLKKGETKDIKIKFDSAESKPGVYKNVLLMESNGGNLTIPIAVEILSKPELVIKLYIGLSTADINGEQVKLDAPPYINKGATMVPLRFISEAFKAKIDWKPIGKGRIILTVPKKTIQLDIGVLYAFINDEKIPLQVPPEIKSGRTFVPLRFIAEGLGAKIAWNASTQQITIIYVIEE